MFAADRDSLSLSCAADLGNCSRSVAAELKRFVRDVCDATSFPLDRINPVSSLTAGPPRLRLFGGMYLGNIYQNETATPDLAGLFVAKIFTTAFFSGKIACKKKKN